MSGDLYMDAHILWPEEQKPEMTVREHAEELYETFLNGNHSDVEAAVFDPSLSERYRAGLIMDLVMLCLEEDKHEVPETLNRLNRLLRRGH